MYNIIALINPHIITQLFFKTQFGQRFKNRFTRQLNDSEEQVSFVTTQDSEEGKAAT